jgi:hypothetical protein
MVPKRDVIFFMAPDLLSVGWKILGMEAGIIGQRERGEKGKRERGEIIGHISFDISHLSFRKPAADHADRHRSEIKERGESL